MGPRSQDAQGEHPAFTDSFWRVYVDSLNKLALRPSGDFIPVNPKKYTAASSAVQTLSKYFETLKLPKPGVLEMIAVLKLPFSQGDVTRAFFLARYFQLSTEGLFLTNENQDRIGGLINYVGAENWENVMCYLDALLFAMFANLESFEPILFVSNQHLSPLVTRLSALMRLYVNLLRLGNLVTTDITMRICEVLLALGFEEALSHKQQDLAAMFEFLTETLAMPLLTFKVEIQHGGKFNEEDDLKISKERILFVSLPEEGSGNILLEECLEHYFNNSVSVKRELERRATLESVFLKHQPKSGASDTAGVPTNTTSSTMGTVGTVVEEPGKDQPSQDLIENVLDRRPSQSDAAGRSRSDSKVGSTRISVRTRSSTISIWSLDELAGKPREVNLSAWMFLRLLPFYTDDNVVSGNKDESLARNSREFVNRRPILPICLKRYSFHADSSTASRSARRIIIPPLINVPEFVAQEDTGDVPAEYMLVLESAVCHRGTSISSGHFVSAVRKYTGDVCEADAHAAPWMLYDDMAKNGRVVEKTFDDIFDTEWPYILFYRLVSTDEMVDSASSSISSSVRSSVHSKYLLKFGLQQGASKKYWQDTLSPIVSTDNVEAMPSRKASTVASIASVPIPDISPSDPRFVDVRNKYFWYVTDEHKLYYKELPTLSKNRTRELSVSISPQVRRNSQWSAGTYMARRDGPRNTERDGEGCVERDGERGAENNGEVGVQRTGEVEEEKVGLRKKKSIRSKGFHRKKDDRKDKCVVV